MRHKARITKISSGKITVLLADVQGCESCGLARSCCSPSSSRPSDDPLRIRVGDTSSLSVGQSVVVEPAGRSSAVAIIYGFVAPLVLLLVAILACSGSADDTLGAAVGLVAVAVYFIILRCFRRRLSTRMRWRLVNQ